MDARKRAYGSCGLLDSRLRGNERKRCVDSNGICSNITRTLASPRILSQLHPCPFPSQACWWCRWSRRWRRPCAPAGSPTPAPAWSRSSGPRATSRATTTSSRCRGFQRRPSPPPSPRLRGEGAHRASGEEEEGESAYFVWLNRGKESLVLDLARADDKALLAAILAKADVFVQNLKPGAVAKLGFPLDALR